MKNDDLHEMTIAFFMGREDGAIEGAEELAQFFHETYERLAPLYNYSTRKDTNVPWDSVPESNKRLMIATCSEIIRKYLK